MDYIKTLKSLFFLFTILFLSSCSFLVNRGLEKNGVFDTEAKLRIIENKKQNKKVGFLGMSHIGTQEFYADVATKIDSLQDLGYIVFYERIGDHINSDTLNTKVNNLKLRKLMGFFPNKYLDTTSNTFIGKYKIKKNIKLINQPNYSTLLVNMETAENGEVGLSQLLKDLESNYGKIKLDSCDYKFNLTDMNYKCKRAKRKQRRAFKKYYALEYRDSILANKIIKSKHQNILVVFGKRHFFGTYFALKNRDQDYKLDFLTF